MPNLDEYGNVEQNPTPTTEFLVRRQLKNDAAQKVDGGKYLYALKEVALSRGAVIHSLLQLMEVLRDEKAEQFMFSIRIEEK
jgi:hypothetical protein